jgi:hypothetical protein
LVLKVMCDWNMCKHNSNKDPNSKEAGECRFEGTIELTDTTNENENSKLICKQFEWEADPVEGKGV